MDTPTREERFQIAKDRVFKTHAKLFEMLDMTTKTFDTCVCLISGNVEMYLQTGDLRFMEATKPAWALLAKHGRDSEAGAFFAKEALDEMTKLSTALKG